MSFIKKLLNPFELIRAFRFDKKQKKHKKSSQDLELMLYSKIIRNDMLHYGYFENIDIEADSISIKDLENAQMKYVDLIIEQISGTGNKVLDVGCGMGGLSNILNSKGYSVDSLTPDNNQKNYIEDKYKDLTVHHMKFEDFEVKDKFNTIINSESLQYIDLQTAFNIIPKILSKNGKWIVIDYFRINRNGINKSGHFHDDFLECVKKNGWKITHQKDITKNALPTLKFAMTFINRFVKPIAIFATEKLKYKKGWIYYLTKELRINMTKKADKELAALNPENFIKEKKYILYVLERQ